MNNEEKANTLTHLVPLIATLIIAYPLMRLTTDMLSIIGTSLFLLGMVLMFLSSTLYHAISEPKVKARLRVFDHIAIYVMIAGSYSPICLSVLSGWMGWTLFIFLWACVLAGVIGKVVALGKHPKLSLALYLAMGWVVLIAVYPLWKSMGFWPVFWIAMGGVAYSLGVIFYAMKRTKWMHVIWHLFVLAGTLIQYFVILFGIVLKK